MYNAIFKVWVLSGILLFLATPSVSALTLSYQGVDTQNQDLTSEIRVISQAGNVFFLRITGGMPDISVLTKTPYIRKLYEYYRTQDTQAVAIFSPPFLYVFAAGNMTRQKVMAEVNYTYVFLQQDEQHFQLSHYFREGEACLAQSEDDSVILNGEIICQPALDTVYFDNAVIYDIQF